MVKRSTGQVDAAVLGGVAHRHPGDLEPHAGARLDAVGLLLHQLDEGRPDRAAAEEPDAYRGPVHPGHASGPDGSARSELPRRWNSSSLDSFMMFPYLSMLMSDRFDLLPVAGRRPRAGDGGDRWRRAAATALRRQAAEVATLGPRPGRLPPTRRLAGRGGHALRRRPRALADPARPRSPDERAWPPSCWPWRTGSRPGPSPSSRSARAPLGDLWAGLGAVERGGPDRDGSEPERSVGRARTGRAELGPEPVEGRHRAPRPARREPPVEPLEGVGVVELDHRPQAIAVEQLGRGGDAVEEVVVGPIGPRARPATSCSSRSWSPDRLRPDRRARVELGPARGQERGRSARPPADDTATAGTESHRHRSDDADPADQR